MTSGTFIRGNFLIFKIRGKITEVQETKTSEKIGKEFR
jgi:hypothetical protein